jgi:hypothetical protein
MGSGYIATHVVLILALDVVLSSGRLILGVRLTVHILYETEFAVEKQKKKQRSLAKNRTQISYPTGSNTITMLTELSRVSLTAPVSFCRDVKLIRNVAGSIPDGVTGIFH